MKKKLTVVTAILGSGLLIFLVLTLILNNLLSEERLKLMLIDPAQKQLGRTITIGAADVSLLTGISLSGIAIKENDSETDFVSVEAFRLRFQLLPLLRKQLVITELLVDQPIVRIVREADGLFNYHDINSDRRNNKEELIPAEKDEVVEPLPLALTFDHIVIKGAVVTLIDKTGILPDVDSEADLVMAVRLGKSLADMKYNGTFNLLANCNYHGHKPVIQVQCEINEKLVKFKGTLALGFDKVNVAGLVTDYVSAPDIELNLDSNSIDLYKLASLRQFISADAPAKNKAREAEVAAVEKKSATLPLAAHGQVKIGELYTSRIKIADLSLGYRLKDNIATLEDFTARIFGGSVNGRLSAGITGSAPPFQGKITADGIRVPEIMTFLGKPAEMASGSLATGLSFQGRGMEWPAVKNSLGAEGNFAVTDGGLHNTPLTTSLATLLDIGALNDLRFDDYSGRLTIADGMVILDSTLQSRDLDLVARGSIGLDGSLDLPLTLHLSPEYSQVLGGKSRYAGYLDDDQGRATLHLKAKGSVQEPRLTLDSRGAEKQARKIIEKKAAEELGRVINRHQKQAQPGDGTEQSPDPVKDMSDRLLKELFSR